jgi:phosphoribosylglycinamide formyltransferase-1
MSKNIAIFASGTPDLWWSWAEKLLEQIRKWEIENVWKVFLVTNYPNWWVAKLSDKYAGIVSDLIIQDNFPKRERDGKFSEENIQWMQSFYQEIIKNNNLDYIFLSGWMKLVLWVEPQKVVNIHPWPVSRDYQWLYWKNLYEKLLADFESWKIKRSCITMHYVTEKYDDWPIIFQYPVEIQEDDTVETLQKRTKATEHAWQWEITNMVINWDIYWDWENNIIFPQNYEYNKEIDLNKF